MGIQYRTKYGELTDKQLVDKVLNPPYNEEAVAYLLYDRYDPLLKSVYKDLTNNFSWFDDCVQELFIHLKGKGCNWHTLATFEWRSSLGSWLSGVAKNDFISTLKKVAPKKIIVVSVDEDVPGKSKVQIPDGGQEEYDRIQRKIALLEAIGQLKDEDQKFVVLKRLQGYNSKEIAILLEKKWKKHGIKKYNNKNELVVPSAGYVDTRMQHAKAILKITII